MLVLSRKVGEEICVPTWGIAIKVLGVKGGGVRLGITAPAEIPVYRAELWERIAAADGPQEDSLETAGMLAAPSSAANEGSVASCCRAVSLAEQLVTFVMRRVGSRVRSLSVRARGEGLVVSGSASSYYVRQLVQSAVREFVENLGINDLDDVDFEIDVQGIDGGGAARPDCWAAG
jgi:carbon storage regulator